MKSLILLLLIIISCSDSSIISPEEIRKFQKIAYDGLSESGKAELVGSWEKGKFTEGSYQTGGCTHIFFVSELQRSCFFKYNEEINLEVNQKLVEISFKTAVSFNQIEIIIDYGSEEIVGYVGQL